MSIFSTQKDEFGVISGILGPFDIGALKSRRTAERESLLKQAEIDKKGLLRFVEYQDTHETYFDKLPEILYGCSEEAIEFAKNFDPVTDSIDAFVEAQKKSAIESTKFSTKLKGLGKTAVGLGKSLAATGLNMLAMFMVTKGIEFIANTWDQYANRVDYANEALSELGANWDEISTKQSDAAKVMSQYAESYDRLSKGVNTQTGENISLNDAEYQQYLEANNAIANSALANIEGVTIAYDEQGNALVRLTGSTQTLADAYDMLAQKTRDEILSSEVMKNWNTSRENNFSAIDDVNFALKLLTGRIEKIEQEGPITKAVAGITQGNDFREVFEAMGTSSLGFYDDWFEKNQGLDLNSKEAHLAYARAVENAFINYLSTNQVELDRSLDLPRRLASTVVEDVFANNSDIYGGLSDIVQKALAQTINNLDYTYFVGKSDQELKEAVKKDFVAPLEHVNAQAALSTMFNSQSSFQGNEISWGAYKKSGTAAVGILEALGVDDNYIEALKEQMGLDGKGVYDTYLNHLREIVEGEDEAWLEGMTRAQLEFANTLVASSDPNKPLTVADFNKAWARSQEEEAYSVEAITAEYNALIEAQNKALEIQKEIGTTGAMTAEQYKELIDMSPDYAEAISGETGYMTIDGDKLRQINQQKYEAQKAEVNKALTLNEKQMSEESQNLAALLEQYKEYAAANDEINKSETMAAILRSQELCESYRDQRKELQALSNELGYATSSYKRWLDAQDAAEKSDAFKGAKSAIEAIREGDESGRRNTEKYKAAEEYILGKEAAQMSKEARDAALKRAESFYDEDGNLALDAWRKASVQVGAQDATTGKWLVDSIDKYAELMGLSQEYTAQAILALSEYNGSFGVDVSQALIDQAKEALPETEVDANTQAVLDNTATLLRLIDAITQQTTVTKTQNKPELSDHKKSNSSKEQTDVLTKEPDNRERHKPLIKPNVMPSDDKVNWFGKLWGDIKSVFEAAPPAADEHLANKTDLQPLEDAASNAAEQLDAMSSAAKSITEALPAPNDEGAKEEKAGSWIDGLWGGLTKFFGSGSMVAGEWVSNPTPPEPVEVPVVANDQEAMETLGDLETTIRETKHLPVAADIKEANEAIADLEKNIKKERLMPVSVSMPTWLRRMLNFSGGKGDLSPTAFSNDGNAYASGTKNAAGGTSLVGEEAPEIVVNKKKGKWFLAKTPQLVNLDKGDTVYNGEQTEDILKGKNVVGGNAHRIGFNNTTASIRTIAVDSTGDDELVEKVAEGVAKGINTNGNGAINKTGSGSGSGTPKAVDPFERLSKLYDWIQRALEVAQRKTQKLVDSVKDFVGYVSQNSALDRAIASVVEERSKNEAGYVRYMQQALEVQQATGLSDELVNRVQNGTIDINEYDDDTRKKIEEYQKWYELAEECEDQVQALREQERELNMQKLDNIITDYENRLDVLSDKATKQESEIELRQARGLEVQASAYESLIGNAERRLEVLEQERNTLEAELLNQVAAGVIKENSEEWHKYRNELEDIDESITDCQVSMIEFGESIYQLRIDKLTNMLGILQQTQTATEDLMSLHEAQGTDNVEGYYRVLIGNSFAQIENLKEQNALLEEQTHGMDVHSEKYQKLLDQIEENDNAIAGLKVSQEQWNDSIADLKISSLEKEKEALQEINDEYQKQLDYEEALEALEKARTQRTKLVFREGIGFRYEADQDAIDAAQKRLDELDLQARIDAIDKQVETIEDNKANDNVYDYMGQSLTNGLEIGSSAFNEMVNQMVNSPVEQGMAGMAVAAKTTELTGGSKAINLSIGDINITDAENSEALAKDIVTRLPNQIIQELYKR